MLHAAENMHILNSGKDQSRIQLYDSSDEPVTNSQNSHASPYQGKIHNFMLKPWAEVQALRIPFTLMLLRQITE